MFSFLVAVVLRALKQHNVVPRLELHMIHKDEACAARPSARIDRRMHVACVMSAPDNIFEVFASSPRTGLVRFLLRLLSTPLHGGGDDIFRQCIYS